MCADIGAYKIAEELQTIETNAVKDDVSDLTRMSVKKASDHIKLLKAEVENYIVSSKKGAE